MMSVPVVAIDGPTASGKGTIAQRVAEALKFHYLDSGALYRLVALRTLEAGVSTDDAARLSELATQLQPSFVRDRIMMNGQDVTDAIRAERVSLAASRLAVHSGVRQALLNLQRARRQPPGLVADGRDMGTVVFPDATLKIYLTASLPARAARRYKQLIDKGFSANILPLSREQIEEEVRSRDQRDSGRVASPLKPASDAIQLDSSELTADQVVALVLQWWRERVHR